MTEVGLRLVVVKTRRPAALRSFYEALGIELLPERHGSGPSHYAGRLGDVVFEVYPLPTGTGAVDNSLRLGFAVAELSRLVEALRSAGTPVIQEPMAGEWGTRAVVRDPDGRAVELYQG